MERDQQESGHFKQIEKKAKAIRDKLRATEQAEGKTTKVMDQDLMEESEEDLESVLREIYGSYVPERLIMCTPNSKEQPVAINTPTRKKADANTISIYLAKRPIEPVKSKHMQRTLERRKTARLQYLPSEDGAIMDAILVAVKPLPKEVKIGKIIIPVPRAEDMDEQQRNIFKNLVQ